MDIDLLVQRYDYLTASALITTEDVVDWIYDAVHQYWDSPKKPRMTDPDFLDCVANLIDRWETTGRAD